MFLNFFIQFCLHVICRFIGINLNALSGPVSGLEKAKAIVEAKYGDQVGKSVILKDTGLSIPFHSRAFQQFRDEIDVKFGEIFAAASKEEEEEEQGSFDKIAPLPWHSSVVGGVVKKERFKSTDFWFELLEQPSWSLRVMDSLFQEKCAIFVELNCHVLYARTFAELASQRYNLQDNEFCSIALVDLSSKSSDQDDEPIDDDLFQVRLASLLIAISHEIQTAISHEFKQKQM